MKGTRSKWLTADPQQSQIPTILPDVLLLDIGLPEIDGYTLARHLRNLPETRNAVFIALTSYGHPDDRQYLKNAGYVHHLVKPIESWASPSFPRKPESIWAPTFNMD